MSFGSVMSDIGSTVNVAGSLANMFGIGSSFNKAEYDYAQQKQQENMMLSAQINRIFGFANAEAMQKLQLQYDTDHYMAIRNGLANAGYNPAVGVGSSPGAPVQMASAGVDGGSPSARNTGLERQQLATQQMESALRSLVQGKELKRMDEDTESLRLKNESQRIENMYKERDILAEIVGKEEANRLIAEQYKGQKLKNEFQDQENAKNAITLASFGERDFYERQKLASEVNLNKAYREASEQQKSLYYIEGKKLMNDIYNNTRLTSAQVRNLRDMSLKIIADAHLSDEMKAYYTALIKGAHNDNVLKYRIAKAASDVPDWVFLTGVYMSQLQGAATTATNAGKVVKAVGKVKK